MSGLKDLPGNFLAAMLAGIMVGGIAAEAHSAAPTLAGTFARIGTQSISRQEYELAVAQAARAKFYHGRPPEGEVQTLRKEVGERLINEVLLLEEAKKRGIGPDMAVVRNKIDEFDARYAASRPWQEQRSRILPGLRQRYERESVLEQLENTVRAGVALNGADAETYYAANTARFTEPETLKFSIILLRVDPSSSKTTWEDARAEAQAIIGDLRKGASFPDVARSRSSDASSKHGGILGPMHRGTIPDPAQLALDKLAPGELSDPVTLLEGIAVLRLEQRVPPRLMPIAAAKPAAMEFLKRERGDAAWFALISQLRQAMPPVYGEATATFVNWESGAGVANTAR